MEPSGFSYSLHSIDLAIIVVYLAATTLLGACFRKGQKDIQAYFVGGREVSWFLVLVSIVATETSTVTFLSVPGLAFNPTNGNLAFLQLSRLHDRQNGNSMGVAAWIFSRSVHQCLRGAKDEV